MHIRWDEDVVNVEPLDEETASSQDGILLNHEYVDYRGIEHEEAVEAVAEEASFLAELRTAEGDPDELEELIEANAEAMGPTSVLEPGVAGLVFAISALGGTPITSCNGGLIGTSGHASDVPHVLFTAPSNVMHRILAIARLKRVGIIRNGAYAEAFANELEDLHGLARALLAPSQPEITF